MTRESGFRSSYDRGLPRYDGAIALRLSDMSVPYHFSMSFRGALGERDCTTLAVMSCSLACMSADVVRGRLALTQLRRTMTELCIRRLETMSYFVDMHMAEVAAWHGRQPNTL